jgi:hypothetical protein
MIIKSNKRAMFSKSKRPTIRERDKTNRDVVSTKKQ